MEQWATNQHFTLIKKITDTTVPVVPVTIDAIKHVIREIVDATTYDQLVVYFAGHGVNIGRSERWLLSDAPDDNAAAVNVPGSETLARFSGIPHVVLISDACRTAAPSIQAQDVKGTDIFPNPKDDIPEKPVDLFYACRLGAPSHEIQDHAAAATGYHAIYTDTLTDALNGLEERILEPDTTQYRVVRPWPLRDHLEIAVAQRLAATHATIVQLPEARITSKPTAWLSRLPVPPSISQERTPAVPPHDEPPPDFEGPLVGVFEEALHLERPRRDELRPLSPREPPSPRPGTLRALSNDLLTDALAGAPPPIDQRLPQANDLRIAIANEATPFGQTLFANDCGINVRGNRITSALSHHALVQPLTESTVSVAIRGNQPAANVWLRFADETSVVVPALREYVTSLTFADDELVSIAYEPAQNTPWRLEHEVNELRQLRATIAAAARFGVFRLEGENTLRLAQRIQYAKTKDPSMAVYAAYAYHDLHERDRISEMQMYFAQQLHVCFFDLAMLARTARPEPIYPFFPMLTQGWALLDAFSTTIPPALAGMERDLAPSLWTQFTPRGTHRLARAWNQELTL